MNELGVRSTEQVNRLNMVSLAKIRAPRGQSSPEITSRVSRESARGSLGEDDIRFFRTSIDENANETNDDLLARTQASPSATGVPFSQYVDVMVDKTSDNVILAGNLYKLLSGQLPTWEQREVILKKDKLSYSIDTYDSKGWNALGLPVAESMGLLDIEKVVSDADEKVDGEAEFMSRLAKCCCRPIDEAAAREVHDNSLRPHISHMGTAKKRGHVYTAYKTRFLVLTDAVLEYYEDEEAYLVGNEAGPRGSIPARDIKVKTSTPCGVDQSKDGYHFTIVNTSSGKVIEFACSDAAGRDVWVRKIAEAYHNSAIQSEKVNLAVYMRTGDDSIGRIHYFHAANEQECIAWTKALKSAIANAKKAKYASMKTLASRIFTNVRSIYNSMGMQLFIVFVIFGNFIVNVLEFELISKQQNIINIFDHLDVTFTTLFTLELAVNMIAHSDQMPLPFLSDGWNILDIVVVLVSVMAVVGNTVADDAGVRAIRVFRAFRVVRLTRHLVALKTIITVQD